MKTLQRQAAVDSPRAQTHKPVTEGVSRPAVNSSISQPVQRQPNRTGLPDNLKLGIEALSGYSMDDVKVHFNSSNPAQLQALAYAQGTDIHVAPRQEKHLPHEAWHVVQQKQGRVRPTFHMKEGINVNEDKGLEKEADIFGSKVFEAENQNAFSNSHIIRESSSFNTQVAQLMRFPQGRSSVFDRRLKGSTPNFNKILSKFFNLASDKAVVRKFSDDSPITLYRADSRPPEIIKKEGFMPMKFAIPQEGLTKGHISTYQNNNFYNPGIVSTSASWQAAYEFQKLARRKGEKSFIYKIKSKGLSHLPQEENIPMHQRLFWSEQEEHMIPGHIPKENIEFVSEHSEE